MKKYLLLLSGLLAGAILLTGCEKKENKIYYTGTQNSINLTSSASTITMAAGQEANTVITFNWTNPNYQFTTGISSQDVTYTIEMDTAGANFSSSRKYTGTVSKDLSVSYTVGTLNGIFGNTLKLDTSGRRSTVEIRIISSINGTIPVTSNVFKLNTNAFSPPPKVVPPSSGRLFIVGSATPGGWNNPVPVPSQEFTKISNVLYQITVPISAGNSYLLLPVNGDWSDKYGGAGAGNNSNVPDGDNFARGGSDLLAPTVSGTYKITVNFQEGKYTLVKQ